MSNTRVTLDLSEVAYQSLEGLVQKSEHASSKAEVLRNALRLYEWFLTQKANGYELYVAKDDSERQVELLW